MNNTIQVATPDQQSIVLALAASVLHQTGNYLKLPWVQTSFIEGVPVARSSEKT